MSGSTIGTGSLTCLRMSKDSADAEGDLGKVDIQYKTSSSAV